MTFLAPLVLLGLVSLAVPLLLHLRRRGDDRTHPFPALRYLRRTTREHAQEIRLRQLVLLALRLGVLLLLALAGARLVLPVGGRDHPPAALVLVVDNGLASGALVGEGRVLDSLVALGLEALDRTGPQDRVWVIPAGEPWRPALPGDPDAARSVLHQMEPSHVTPDLAQAVARARALIRSAEEEVGQVLLLSNLPSGAVPSRSEEEPGSAAGEASPAVLVISPELALPPNRGIARAMVDGGFSPRVGELGEIQVQVTGTEASGATVRLHLDGELAGAGRVGPDGFGILSLPPLPAGWAAAQVEVEPDDLRADDVRHLAFRVEAPPRVAVLGERPSFLQDALDVLEAAGRLVQAPPEEAQLLLAGAGADLTPWSPRLPTVLLAPEDPGLLPAANRILNFLRPGWRLEPEPGEPRAARTLEVLDPGLRLPGSPEVRRVFRLVRDGEGSPRVLLRLSDGTPWLMDLQVPDRSVLLLASPLIPEAGDVPTSAAMIPLADFLTSMPEARLGIQGVTAGSPLPLPTGARSLRRPDGTLVPLDGMWEFAETGRSGIYDILDVEGELLARVPVNPIPVEAGPPLTPREAALRLGHGVQAVDPAGEGWAAGILADRRGREVWQALATLAFLLLLVEGWYAGRGRLLARRDPPAATEPLRQVP